MKLAKPSARQRLRAERLLIIGIEAFDWTCSQYIKPRFDSGIAPAIARLPSRIADLGAELARRQSP